MAIRTKKLIFVTDAHEIEGRNGDKIDNAAIGEWNFGGAIITGAVLVGNEALAQSELNLWVDPEFTSMPFPFFSTPQAAINAITTSDYNNRFVVNILPGNYSGFIIDNKDFITIKGHGIVHIGTLHGGSSPTGVIKIKDSSNFVLENLMLTDTHYDFNPEAEINVIDIESSFGNIDRVNILFRTLVKTTDYIFRGININATGGNVSIKDSFIDASVDCDANNPAETVSLIEFTDPTDALKLRIENSKFKFTQSNWDSLTPVLSTETNVININSSSSIKYFVFITNSEFELQYDGQSIPVVIDGDVNNVGLFNSFSNKAIDINVIGNNNIEDADFIISNTAIL